MKGIPIFIFCNLLFLACANVDSSKKKTEPQKKAWVKNTPKKKALGIKDTLFDSSTQIAIGVFDAEYARFRSDEHDNDLKNARYLQQITLNQEQKHTLFHLLYEKSVKGEAMNRCFHPRHSITFHKKEKMIGYIEICFECNQTREYGLPKGLRSASQAHFKNFFDEIGLHQPQL